MRNNTGKIREWWVWTNIINERARNAVEKVRIGCLRGGVDQANGSRIIGGWAGRLRANNNSLAAVQPCEVVEMSYYYYFAQIPFCMPNVQITTS
jgi:hypothetical protein